MANRANGGHADVTMEEMKYLIKKPLGMVGEEKQQGDGFLGHQ